MKRWMRRWTQFGAATAALALGVMLGAGAEQAGAQSLVRIELAFNPAAASPVEVTQVALTRLNAMRLHAEAKLEEGGAERVVLEVVQFNEFDGLADALADALADNAPVALHFFPAGALREACDPAAPPKGLRCVFYETDPERGALAVDASAALAGDIVSEVVPISDPSTGRGLIDVRLTPQAAARLCELTASRLGAGIAVLQGRYYLTARSITEPICAGSLRISGFPNLGWAGLRAARLARPLYPADVRVAAAKEIGAAPFWSKLTYLQPWLSDKFSRRLDGIWR